MSANPSTTLPLPERLRRIRERLLASRTYIGDPNLKNNVEWVRLSNAHRLILTPQTASSTTGEQQDGPPVTATDDSSELAPTSDVSEAVLSGIFYVDHTDFWFLADGGYRGPSPFGQMLDGVKPTFATREANVAHVNADLPTIRSNILWIRDSVATAGSLKRGYVLDDAGRRIRLRHSPLFYPASTTEGDDNEELGVDFSIHNWPVTSAIGQEELESLKNTHRVNPFPVYDTQGNLMKPQDYKTLRGALVEAHFTLTHWGIPGRDGNTHYSDTYAADITTVRMLAPAQGYLPSSNKRTLAKDPFFDADEMQPSKKTRTSKR